MLKLSVIPPKKVYKRSEENKNSENKGKPLVKTAVEGEEEADEKENDLQKDDKITAKNEDRKQAAEEAADGKQAEVGRREGDNDDVEEEANDTTQEATQPVNKFPSMRWFVTTLTGQNQALSQGCIINA